MSRATASIWWASPAAVAAAHHPPKAEDHVLLGSRLDRFGGLLFFVAMTIVVNPVVDVGASYGQSFLAHSMSAAALIAALRATGVRPRRRRVVEAVVLALLTVLGIIALVEGLTSLDLPEAARVDPLWLVLVVTLPVLVIRRMTRHTVVGMRRVAGAVSAESVLGQIFLVTVVAIVVARFAGERRPIPCGEERG
jgi:hypothetical protein